MNRFDKASIQQVTNLLLDLYIKLWPNVPHGLLDWLGSFFVLSSCMNICGLSHGILVEHLCTPSRASCAQVLRYDVKDIMCTPQLFCEVRFNSLLINL